MMIQETKKELRKRIIAERDLLSEEERMHSQVLLTERILGHQWFYRAKELLIFISYGSEIDTGEIIAKAHCLHKKVYVPKVEGDVMEFYRIMPNEALQEGYKGILEPDLSVAHEKFIFAKEKAEEVLMIMPGVAFDMMCNRIGYGKGFYDKYLADKDGMQTIAVGYAMQMVPQIEADEKDIRPMQVICL